MRRRAEVWQHMTPEQQIHIKNDCRRIARGRSNTGSGCCRICRSRRAISI
jgi:hypothetical protein